jgi:NADPH-dependent 2,4-dienoyl-CoA reductase/sulfur reductase-like enzyme/Fe-S-cluster-containing hydrogenase component 2/bacterioferritin-associated ferredoxin
MMSRIHAHPLLTVSEGREEVRFFFDGEAVTGFLGEPVASALMARGIRVFSLHPKDKAPQGLFCANGQCSQCTVLIDGIPRKACVTPLKAGMDVRTLKGLPALPESDEPLQQAERRTIRTDILVIGAGPSGLSAAYELGRMGFQVIVADDKEAAGGKLVLQTHKFFGSEQDCYAGVRGMDIATMLEAKLHRLPNVTVLRNAPVVAVFKDRKAGIYKDYASYVLVEFTALVVAAGAREKGVLFPGNDLPGVYGAGAFQTLVNRDLVKAAKRVFIVGSGNVGLIAAYHALQAGIEVAGIAEIMGRINGYKVHADKIRRMGVPLHLNTTVLRVEGEGKVERVVTAQVDDQFRPVPGTGLVYEVDTVLIATGLAPCDEFLRQARSYGILAVAAGDAEEIAEASSALFGGKIAALTLAKMLGKKVQIDESWLSTREVLKSRPGDSFARSSVLPGPSWRPVFFCSEEIPCNPCTTVCPISAIHLRPLRGTIMDLPYFEGEKCLACMACVSVCPGLAISLVRSVDGGHAEVVLPWEFNADFPEGREMDLVNQEGAFVERAPVIAKRYNKKNKTWLLTFRTSLRNAASVAGIRVQDPAVTGGRPVLAAECTDLNAYVCRCERITLGEIVQFIRDNKVRDVNQLKTLRVGMGACGGKTCSQLLGRAFKLAGVDMAEVEPATVRPLFMEVPLGEIVNEGLNGLGGKDAGQRGAP